MNVQSTSIVDATIRKYLADAVRERFKEDVHLIEPMLETLVARYSLKKLFMTCALEISRLKNKERREREKPAMV